MFEDQIRKYDNLVSQYKKIVSDKFCKQDFIEYNEIYSLPTAVLSRGTVFLWMKHVPSRKKDWV